MQGDVDLTRSFRFSRYLSPMFTLTFAVFVLILLFNLLIAVMSEGYEDVRVLFVLGVCRGIGLTPPWLRTDQGQGCRDVVLHPVSDD